MAIQDVGLRTARAEELARIESTREVLRRSTRWVRIVGFIVPGAAGVLVTITMIVACPGAWWEKLLGIVLQLAALAGVLTLPLLLSSTGRTLGGLTFTVSNARARALHGAIPYRVYAFRQSGYATAAEIAES